MLPCSPSDLCLCVCWWMTKSPCMYYIVKQKGSIVPRWLLFFTVTSTVALFSTIFTSPGHRFSSANELFDSPQSLTAMLLHTSSLRFNVSFCFVSSQEWGLPQLNCCWCSVERPLNTVHPLHCFIFEFFGCDLFFWCLFVFFRFALSFCLLSL